MNRRLLLARIKELTRKREVWWPNALGLLAFTVGLAGKITGPIPYLPIVGLEKFHKDLSSELIGIGIVVLIIDNANRAIATREEKERLVLQMGSPDNGFAVEAVRMLRARGWLSDSTLHKAYLERADLSYTNLRYADLRGANLRRAELTGVDLRNAIMNEVDLRKAILIGAKLTKTDLTGANLSGVVMINKKQIFSAILSETTIMPDGSKYGEGDYSKEESTNKDNE